MNEIDKYLDEVCGTLGGSRDLREHVREELRDHLIDAVEANVARGLSKEDATRKAIENFGKPEETKSGLEALYGHSLTAFLVDRAMAWKERNMKSGWKWSFAAMTILVIATAIEALLTFSIFVFVVPKIREAYEVLGQPVPSLVSSTIRVAQYVCQNGYALLWALFAAAALIWIVFELRSKSENKAVLRLAGAAFATLLVTVAFSVTATVTIIALAQQTGSALQEDPAPFVQQQYSDAGRAVAALRVAMKNGDRAAMASACTELSGALLALSTKRSATALIAASRTGDAGKVMSLVDAMSEQNRHLLRGAGQEMMDALDNNWDLLAREVRGESVTLPAPPPAPESPSEDM